MNSIIYRGKFQPKYANNHSRSPSHPLGKDFSPQKFDSGRATPDTASVASQTDIRLQKDAVRPDLRWEIKKLCDRSTIDGQRVISSVCQYSSFYSK